MNSADEQGKPGNKGFAGLSKLVSKVDIPAAPAPPPARTNPQPAPSPAPTSASAPTKAPDARPAAPYNPPVGKQGRGTAWGWLVGIGGFIAFVVLSSQNGTTRSGTSTVPTSAPSTYSVPASSASPIDPSTVKWDSPSASLVEAMPPPGTNLVLSGAQVRYCLAEHIRMDAARTAVDNYSDHDVDLFNSMVANFNSRCSSYRYRDRDMNSARNDVEARRNELQRQGMSRLH